MKKNLLIALLLIPVLGFSQTTKPIDGFLGIKFGSTKAQVIAAAQAKGGKLNLQKTHGDIITLSNVRYGHRNVDVMLVKLVDGKAFEADLFFNPDVEAHVIDYYNEVVSDLTEVYGTGEVIRKFTDPYKEGDNTGDILLGISAGKVDFETLWQAANNNTIDVSIETEMVVKISYQDDKLTDAAIAKQKAKDKSDY